MNRQCFPIVNCLSFQSLTIRTYLSLAVFRLSKISLAFLLISFPSDHHSITIFIWLPLFVLCVQIAEKSFSLHIHYTLRRSSLNFWLENDSSIYPSPNSPDLRLLNYFLFWKLEMEFKGSHFAQLIQFKKL